MLGRYLALAGVPVKHYCYCAWESLCMAMPVLPVCVIWAGATTRSPVHIKGGGCNAVNSGDRRVSPHVLDCMTCTDTGTCGTAAATSHPGKADAASATAGPACKAGQEVARELLLQSCRIAGVEWPPGSVLTCAAWTFLAACLPDQPQALGQLLEDVDVENLELVLHGLQYCMEQAPKPPALWPDTLLWYYLLLSAKVCLCCPLAISLLQLLRLWHLLWANVSG